MTVLTDREIVFRAAEELGADPAVAAAWYSSDSLPVFDGKTAEQLVAEGRASDVLRYIEVLGAGFAG
jgi:hypothetical protein